MTITTKEKAEPASPAKSKCNPQLLRKGVPVQFYRNETDEALVVVYDLRDAAACARAHRERSAWGKELCIVHALDNDHIALEFLPGGALEASA